MVEPEQSAEGHRLALALATRQSPDLEAWESLMLQAAHQGGAGVLSLLLAHWQQHAPREVVLCECGGRMTSRGRRAHRLFTTLSRFPDDERLDIRQTTCPPGVRRLMARAGRQANFEAAAEDLHCSAKLQVDCILSGRFEDFWASRAA